MLTTCNIFETIKTIRAASAPAHKAWRTMREQDQKRSEAAKKAWCTIRANQEARSERALKAWETRRAQAIN